MRKITLVSLTALALAGCAAAVGSSDQAPIAEATPLAPPVYAPVIPKGTGIFAERSTLPFHAPDFSKIKDSDFLPAIEQGIAIKLAEMEAIAGDPALPTFENTLVAMEQAGQMLTRTTYVFSALTAANTNDTLDAIDKETSPKLTALDDTIYLNDKLFARVKYLYERKDQLGLRADQQRLLQVTYDRFVKNGATLTGDAKEQLKTINGRISTLQTEYGQKLTAATKDAALIISDKRKLAGLSASDIAGAAKAAEDRGLKGKWVLVLQNTTQQPLLASLKDRATRKALFEASWNRAQRGNAHDTRALIAELAQLRAEKAKLLGFPDFATFTMSDQMAKNPTTAIAMMQQMVPALAAQERKEAGELNALIKRSGGKFTVQPWDWTFYSERLRKEKYAFDESETKPYFEITNVLENGVFYAANQLYGLTFKKRSDIPVYHPDVTVYTVYDKDGSELALFYFDPWKRDNKQGGAWMSNFVDQSHLFGTKPVVFNVQNSPKPAPGQPALVSFSDAETMFHEFGHALHGMLSDQTYPSLSGANTARDFVEFPSQFNEYWMTEPRVFANFAKHYQTGAPMPAALVAKVQAAAKYGQGFALGEVITAAMLDQKWHAVGAAAGKQDVDAFEGQALSQLGLETTLVPPRYRTSYFRHIWGGGYSAGYYAYVWTEMLQHDAYQWFVDNGGMTRANGQRFRDMVLSRGSSIDYPDMYRAFAGRDPSIEPMLKARGLK
ncbi:MAG: M3 family metallopeptidase [Sphingomonadales bacterium]|nr:M3 family metallopeptidase [Sphingomonadaceae bacterium]MBS3930013.1 M3 family metallopeptidase [Sphingomonadales bacterium]